MKGKKVYELINDDTVDFDNGYVIYSEDGIKNLKAPVQMFADAVLESYRDGCDEDWIDDDTEHEPTETDNWIADETNGVKYLYNQSKNTKYHSQFGTNEYGKRRLEAFYNPYGTLTNRTYKHQDNTLFHDGWQYIDGIGLLECKPYPDDPTGSFYNSPGDTATILFNKLYNPFDTLPRFSLNQAIELKAIMKKVLDIRSGREVINGAHGDYMNGTELIRMGALYDDINEGSLLYDLPIGYMGRFEVTYSPKGNAIVTDTHGQGATQAVLNHKSFVIYPSFYKDIPGFADYFVGAVIDDSDITIPYFSILGYNTFTHHPSGNIFYEFYQAEFEQWQETGESNVLFFNHPIGIEEVAASAASVVNSAKDWKRNGIDFPVTRLMLPAAGDDGIALGDWAASGDTFGLITFDVEGYYPQNYVTSRDYFTQDYIARRYNWSGSSLSNQFAEFGGFGNLSPNHELDLSILTLDKDYMIAHKASRLSTPVVQQTIADENIFIGDDGTLTPYCRYIWDKIYNDGMSIDGRPYISKFQINSSSIVEETQLSHQSQANVVVKAANGLAVVREHNVLRLGLTTEMYNTLQPKLNFGDGIDYDEETGVVSADGLIDDILVNGRSVVSNKVASIDLTNLNLIQECQLQTSFDGYTRITEQETKEYDDFQIQHTYRDYTIDISSDIVPTEQTYYSNQVNVGPYEYSPYTAGSTQTLYSYESYIVIFDVVIVSPVDAAFCLFLKDNSHPTGYPFDPSNQYYDSDYVDFDIQDVKANIPTKFRIVKVAPATTGRSSYTSNSYQAAIMNTLPYSEWPLPSNIYAYCNTTVKKLINT